ncbi:uncharacterized protein KY384_001160 [Bacidia gigantensis]|uniref:uncharacterized protein n=1 Tax=Bacidia gigantensis TaxID=2732470 RepID=UPI001D04F240|nr:uncharacterized protein KY384_001160 [Bacidia gigantensis]KAG8534316.1 hypothetical protein KY384_001160 [Bacidia gigantensis]
MENACVLGVQGQKPEALYFSLCGVDNIVSIDALRTEYAAHGTTIKKSNVPICPKATEYRAINETLSAPRDLDAIVAQNEAICKSNGGVFNTEIEK